MAHEKMLAAFEQAKQKALGMGGPEKLARRKAEGHMNARERLGALLDADSWIESGLFATSHRPEMRERTPADSKIAGFGEVEGRPVAVVSNDFTVLGASSSVVNGKKIRHMREVASKSGMPLVMLGESTGARMPDRMGAEGRAILGQDPHEYRRLRESPWVSALLGACYGSSTWYACLSDFVVMRRGATMAVASGRVTSAAIRQEIDSEELGGWKMHAETSGLVDAVVETDDEALALIRRWLGYLPSHHNEAPPVHEVPAGSEGRGSRILELMPEDSSKVYDVRKIIETVVDVGSMMELKPKFGRSICTAFARIEGRSVGILANNPLFKGGAIDVDACNKAIGFLVLCDSFNIPIVFMVDQPGFLIGVEGERRAAPGRIMNWMNALALITVPKISLIMRKSYGQAYLNMGGGRNSDEVICWPTADLGFMAPNVGANVLFGVKEEDDPQRYRALVEELSRDTSGYRLASLYETQAVIDPRDTRQTLARLLEVHRTRLGSGVGKHLLANWPTTY
ncbi:carboxyl transferase domain-containing protein [Variovorax defluvii]|uniref:Carboxyl transferase domain-containing protein n=1 Tax=Variovorax defluvii TaxID=913761 RepID=A0ABP8I1A4_9BURK